jgi:hypothetical protein
MHNDERLAEFLAELDLVCRRGCEQGLSPRMISGALLARCQHWYLSADGSAIEELLEFMRYSMKKLEDRPRFDIK